MAIWVARGSGLSLQIDAVGVAVFRHLLQQRHQALGQADEERRGFRARRDRRGFRVEENDEVDIARIVEFAGAQLAHGQDHIARTAAGVVARADPQLAGVGRRSQQIVDRHGKDGIGEIGQRRQHGIDGQCRGEIGQRQQQRAARPRLANEPHELLIGPGVSAALEELVAKHGEDRSRLAVQAALEPGPFLEYQLAQKRRTAERAGSEIAGVGIGRDPGGKAGGALGEVDHGSVCRSHVHGLGKRNPVLRKEPHHDRTATESVAAVEREQLPGPRRRAG